MHYEIMGLPESPQVDSMQFHVSSSLDKAEVYIRRVKVDAYSWWQVHPYEVDFARFAEFDEGAEVYYYSHRGTRLRAAPMKRAISAFRKHAARHPEWWPPHPPS